METYTILNLLMFLKAQQKNEYRGIDAIFEILEDKRIPEAEKMPVVLSILRQLGLEEEECFEPDHICSNHEDQIRSFVPFRIDRFRIPILNSLIPYDAVLN